MADQNVNVKVNFSSSGSTQVAGATTQVTNALNQATKTANGAAQAQEAVKKSSGSSAQGFLMLAQAAQDAQYGFAGVVNNIPGIITGLGMGAGVAGVVSMAAVGVQVLTKNVDIFGTEAAKATKEANELRNELMDSANAAFMAAKSAEQNAEAERLLAEEVKKSDDAYKSAINSINESHRAKISDLDATSQLIAATQQLTQAQIDLAEARKEITPEEATRRRNLTQIQGAEERQRISEQMMQAEIDKRRQTVEAEAGTIGAAAQQRRKLAQDGLAILSEEERDLTKKNVATIKSALEGKQAELAASADNIRRQKETIRVSQSTLTIDDAKQKLATESRKYDILSAEQRSMISSLGNEEAKLKADKVAQDKTQIADEKALLEKLKTLKDQEAAAQERLTKAIDEQAELERKMLSQRRIFDVTQQAVITGQEAARQRAQTQKETELRGGYPVEFVGPLPPLGGIKESNREQARKGTMGIADALKGEVPQGGIAALQRAAEGIASGDQRQIKELARLLGLLAKRQTKQDAEIESLLTKVNDMIVAK
jgi:hypothetical protein